MVAGSVALVSTAWIFGKWGYTANSLLLLKLRYFVAGMFVFRGLRPGVGSTERVCLLVAARALAGYERHDAHLWILSCLVLLAMLCLGKLEASSVAPRLVKLLCANPVVRDLADTSYGIYLFHGFFISTAGLILRSNPALTAFQPAMRVAAIAAFVIPMAVLTSWLSFRLIERLGQGLGAALWRMVATTRESQSF